MKLGRMSDDELLSTRICDLRLRIGGTPIHRRIKRLYKELEHRGIRFLPHVWLSSEFFTPDGVTGFAIPFYLAHSRLIQLERWQMLEAEGSSERECMRILRHEAGHCLDNAYRLHVQKSWRKVFGRVSQPYPEFYRPKPNSRRYVLHLDAWYAQAHPLEDYAETFAVWLRPRSQWRSRYQGWPALQKLQYVDSVMKRIAKKRPSIRNRIRHEPLSQIKITLGEYYVRKRERYLFAYPPFYDRDLLRIFSHQKKAAARPTAAAFFRHFRRELRDEVAEGTGVHAYAVDHVLEHLMERAKELRLRLAHPIQETRRKALILLTAHTMNVVHSGRYRFWYGV